MSWGLSCLTISISIVFVISIMTNTLTAAQEPRPIEKSTQIPRGPGWAAPISGGQSIPKKTSDHLAPPKE